MIHTKPFVPWIDLQYFIDVWELSKFLCPLIDDYCDAKINDVTSRHIILLLLSYLLFWDAAL
jgi:hypothetical protein